MEEALVCDSPGYAQSSSRDHHARSTLQGVLWELKHLAHQGHLGKGSPIPILFVQSFLERPVVERWISALGKAGQARDRC